LDLIAGHDHGNTSWLVAMALIALVGLALLVRPVSR